MKYAIEIDGELQEIDIRVMDERLIVWRKMLHAPLTADDMATADPEYLALAALTVVSPCLRSSFASRFGLLAVVWSLRGRTTALSARCTLPREKSTRQLEAQSDGVPRPAIASIMTVSRQS